MMLRNIILILLGSSNLAFSSTSDNELLDVFLQIYSLTGVNPLLENGYFVIVNNFTQTVMYDLENPVNGESKVLTLSPTLIASSLDYHHYWRLRRATESYIWLVPVGGTDEGVVCSGLSSVTVCHWTDSSSSYFTLEENGPAAYFMNAESSKVLAALASNSSVSVLDYDFFDPKQQWLLCNPTNVNNCWPSQNPNTQTKKITID